MKLVQVPVCTVILLVGNSEKYSHTINSSQISKKLKIIREFMLKNFIIEKGFKDGLNKKFKYIDMHNWVQHTQNLV